MCDHMSQVLHHTTKGVADGDKGWKWKKLFA